MEYLHLTLKGLAPLLMHNPESMGGTKKKEGLSRKTVPTPEEEAAAGRYLLPDGNFFVPAVAVRNCILSGSKGYRIGKRAAKEILAGTILLIDECFPVSRDGAPLQGDQYSIDTRRAVVQRQGIPRSRPRIEMPWEIECAFGYNSNFADLDTIKSAAVNAGQIVGLLDYRPERMGWFGRFEVAEIWSEKKEE